MDSQENSSSADNRQEEAQTKNRQESERSAYHKNQSKNRPTGNRDQNRNRGYRGKGENKNMSAEASGGRNQSRGTNRRSNTPRNVKQGGRSKFAAATDQNLRECVLRNQKIHEERLNPYNKIDLNNDKKVKITPLGGLGEIGGNITVFETEDEAILVDVGMSFPDEEMHGVDILVPDYTYLRQIKDKLVAILITHGHEDHIGAVSYLFKEMQLPLYGTTLPLAMISNRFDEHHMQEFKKYFRPIEKRTQIKIGNDFEVEWMHITHSIIDASSLAITTDAGTIIHTGDFKIDHTPIDGYTTDLHRFAYYGERGVLCMLSDSTNSHNPGTTLSELSVAPAFDRLYAKVKGRVFVSTFSSNIHRVYQAIEYGLKYGRKVCVIGRSMERNLELAMNYDYIKLPTNMFIEPHELGRYKDSEVLIVTTGSQGEPNSALFRMSIGEHRHVKIKPTDTVILSARAIPGNEGSISKVVNHLQRAGAHVLHNVRDIHVSGHGAQEEQKLLLRLVQPKFFLPIHGEYNHIMKHKNTAIECGVSERNIYLMEDGDQIEVSAKFMRKARSVKTGKTYIDNQNNHKIENDIVLDRQSLATEGIVNIVAQVSKSDSRLIGHPRVSTFGIIANKQEHAFGKEIAGVLEQYMLNIKPGLIENQKALENDLRGVVRKHIYRKTKKYPMIVPTLFVM